MPQALDTFKGNTELAVECILATDPTQGAASEDSRRNTCAPSYLPLRAFCLCVRSLQLCSLQLAPFAATGPGAIDCTLSLIVLTFMSAQPGSEVRQTGEWFGRCGFNLSR